MNINDPTYIKSLFALISAGILTNFVGTTLGCKIQKLFSNSVLVKQLLIFILIYSSINVININQPPTEHLFNSIYIWILFITFTKNTLKMTYIIMLSMIIMIVTENHLTYYELNKDKYDKNDNFIKFIKIVNKFLKSTIVFMLFLGHFLYVYRKYQEFGKDFDLKKLYFSTNCKLD